ncbi:MAG TPA: sigma-54 dependent transcriptional regulator [Terriglobales bacterium]
MVSQAIPAVEFNSEFPPEDVMFGRSDIMHELRTRIRRVAAANVPVLVVGEGGTGKGTIARMIHRLSPWANGTFSSLCCPAIPATLLENGQFLAEKMSVAGANGVGAPRLDVAPRGTLFLDEISELDLTQQAKLVRILRGRQFGAIGAQENSKVEIRLVCATNRELASDMKKGLFRADLYYRVNVVSLRVPPLRERRCDIEVLAHYFLERFCQEYPCRGRVVSAETLSALQEYDWPGNVRELKNLIKRYVILGSDDVFRSELTPRNERTGFDTQMALEGNMSLKDLTRKATRELEGKIILQALEAHRWNRRATAEALSISYRSLLYKIRDAGLSPSPRNRPVSRLM